MVFAAGGYCQRTGEGGGKVEQLIRWAESQGCRCVVCQPMSELTSFRIGGPVDAYIVSPNEAVTVIEARAHATAPSAKTCVVCELGEATASPSDAVH